MAEGPIEALAMQLLQRELNKPAIKWQAPQEPSKPSMKPIPPEIASLLGIGADALSTYKFLHEGVGTEGNPLLREAFNHHPTKTALGVAAGGLGMMLGRNLLRKMGGETGHKIADMLAGNGAAEQMSIAADNFKLLDTPDRGRLQRDLDTRSSFQKTQNRLRTGLTQQE